MRKETSNNIHMNQKPNSHTHQYIPPPPFKRKNSTSPTVCQVLLPHAAREVSQIISGVGRAWPADSNRFQKLLGKNPAGEAGKTLTANGLYTPTGVCKVGQALPFKEVIKTPKMSPHFTEIAPVCKAQMGLPGRLQFTTLPVSVNVGLCGFLSSSATAQPPGQISP